MISNVQDGAAVTGLVIAGASLVAVNSTGNAIYDPIGSIIVGNLLGMVCDVSFLSKFMHNFFEDNLLLSSSPRYFCLPTSLNWFWVHVASS